MGTLTNIRNWRAFHDAAWDWTPLNTCFANTRIRVMDIDGIVERNGYFLLLEGKRLSEGEHPRPLPVGQQLTHNALCRLGTFTIVVFWGVIPKTEAPPMRIEWIRYLRIQTPSGISAIQKAGASDLLQIVRNWFIDASRKACGTIYAKKMLDKLA